jgi:hypothetical protein
MEKYLYLSIMPETLVASMLPPEEFGTYLAVGSQRKIPREAMFFSLDAKFSSKYFDMSLIKEKCVPHKDGRPKKSLYISIYRVLEHIPLTAIKNLYLVTRDGRVLEIAPAPVPPESKDKYHLYAELCPVCPLVMSSLSPAEFCKAITSPAHPLHISAICFMNKIVPDLTVDDTSMGIASVHAHIIETYKSMAASGKKMKIVDRRYQVTGWNRGIKDGFFIGNKDKLLFFPMSPPDEMDAEHHEWWRSANLF